MIRKLFNVGNNLAANQNSSVEPKEAFFQTLFKFREIELGDPFFSGGIYQKYNFKLTNEVAHIIEGYIDSFSGIFYGDKVFPFAFKWFVVFYLE